jgi:hypothetical protein
MQELQQQTHKEKTSNLFRALDDARGIKKELACRQGGW